MAEFARPDIEVEPERVRDLLREDGALVVDVREGYEWEAGHLDGTRHVELERLASESATIGRERPVVFLCRLGARSAMAAQAFRAAGYDAWSMRGGVTLWHERGFPLVPEDGHVADH